MNLNFFIDTKVLSSFQPIEKETLVETDSNVTPKETDYVRINMVVKSEVRHRRTSAPPKSSAALAMGREDSGGETTVEQDWGK